jgi:hypothetical protein
MQERSVDVRKFGDLPHRYTVNSMPGEQFLRRVENTFARRKTSLRTLRWLVVEERAAQRPLSNHALFLWAIQD